MCVARCIQAGERIQPRVGVGQCGEGCRTWQFAGNAGQFMSVFGAQADLGQLYEQRLSRVCCSELVE
jgi:hypothetical protein